jgi:NitT/TauT family transport system substrate-binding protein
MRLVSAHDWARCGGATGRPRRRVAGVTAAAAGLVLVAGCHLLGTSSAAGPTGSGTVTVAAAPGVADAPLYIAIKNGLFRQAGINVRVVAASSVSAELAALKAGKVDIAFGDYADFFYAEQLKPSPDLNIVANGYNAAPGVMQVLTLPHSNITSPAGLAGKTIGTARPQEMSYSTKRPYSEETIATWSVLSSDNVEPASIRWQTMATSNLVTALQNRQVDAILATEPTIYAAESQLGAVPVLDAGTGAAANLPLDGYFSNATYAKKSAANLVAFRAALLKAQGDATMASSVQSALQHYARLPVETASLVTLGTYPTSLQAPDLQRVANIMFNFNAEPAGTGTLSVSSMVLHR